MDNKETADKDSSANILHVVPPVLYCQILDAPTLHTHGAEPTAASVSGPPGPTAGSDRSTTL